MSQIHIQAYLRELADIRLKTGSTNETVLREAFKGLLKSWGKSVGLFYTSEYPVDNAAFKYKGSVDGALLYELRRPFGYWEAKDSHDKLDDEIAKKFKRGYPQDNIIFEDTQTLVLIQNRVEVGRCSMQDAAVLERYMKAFFAYQRPEIAQFRQAVEHFKTELPAILEALRSKIAQAQLNNPAFQLAAADFLNHCRNAVNPKVTAEDVCEMLLQHVLTEEIFANVFNESDFHRQNNIAQALYGLEATFFTGSLKKNTLKSLEPYYAAIRASAAEISSHSEKQKFLKSIYANFYQVYNKKAADRLGVVYTPNEIVRFMIEATDWLTQNHFGKNLIHPDVEILDPATGTGTFICELLEYFKGSAEQLKHKYQYQLHANEVAILPYYVANLNIEATYAALAGSYEEFPNLCFVDTLDNLSFAQTHVGAQVDLDIGFSEENVERIKRQNSKKINVIIGNPPYNANQVNENDNNKNRSYASIDKHIKQTYVAQSTAQKTKLYDMYARFFRWASNRLGNTDGVIAFITNRSFIDSRTFDGFRKTLAQEFTEIWVMDLGGDVRVNPKLSGTKHNVFGIQTGVAISFLVRKNTAVTDTAPAKIFYARRPEFDTAQDKLAFIDATKLNDCRFSRILPDDKHNWLNLTQNNFYSLLPVINKETKAAKTQAQENAIFKLYSLGVVTNRDEWVYDDSIEFLTQKIKNLISIYNSDIKRIANLSMAQRKNLEDEHGKDYLNNILDYQIKWTRAVKNDLKKNVKYKFDKNFIIDSLYRPFVKKKLYFSQQLNEMRYQIPLIYGSTSQFENKNISISGGEKFRVLSSNRISDLHFIGDNQCLPLYRYDNSGNRSDNITDWGQTQFTAHYGKAISKEAIFHYVYAVLHHPAYRAKYAQNLKRDFPRIPLYGKTLGDFNRWATWGKALMELHIGYETLAPYPLTRRETPNTGATDALKPRLKANHNAGTIVIDDCTTLGGIPGAAWAYTLGTRSALEWVLDQYKESTPKDPTLREKFDTYRFADYKEHVVDLLGRVCAVSVATQKILSEMPS
jgi:predicted helicase